MIISSIVVNKWLSNSELNPERNNEVYVLVVCCFNMRTGRKTIKAIMERIIPAMVPTAKANQKTSFGPSKRKGTRPRTVERMVREIGTILWSKARTYARTDSSLRSE